ncbi:TIGR04211 family SH3 domain-containing protein [Veronia pacifica]|uniref:Arylsulfatase n=1 Tax=Veronia pacifica TaxID=1080227 RepID=A0A1C3EQ89_9GAMM|nr:TIGR04211 family SH3 domain-containing protein [Veronia pacifica]ODA35417.1 arylsulfatase [Veronia pacifica]
MKQLFSALAMLMLLLAPGAFAKSQYVSEDLFTYMHSGPGTKYRIIGSVDSGEAVTVIGGQKDGYSQIIDSRGRKGWINSKYVSDNPGLKVRMPALEKELKTLKSALNNAQQDADSKQKGLVESLELRSKQLQELEVSNSQLRQKLEEALTEKRELSAKLDTQKDDLLMRYFLYGGIVAGVGLLFGLLLPHLIPKKKQHPRGWA